MPQDDPCESHKKNERLSNSESRSFIPKIQKHQKQQKPLSGEVRLSIKGFAKDGDERANKKSKVFAKSTLLDIAQIQEQFGRHHRGDDEPLIPASALPYRNQHTWELPVEAPPDSSLQRRQ